MPDTDAAAEGPPRELTAPRTLLRALAGVARHEAAIRTYQESRMRQLMLEQRWRSTAAAHHVHRAKREDDRAEREADRVHREAVRVHRAALRAELEQYVRGLKGRGLPPERVLVVVKALVADAAMSTEPPLHDPGVLTDEVVQWSLDAYFGTA